MNWGQVVGDNVHRLRSAVNMSLADLAAAAGISKTTLHGIEQGQGNPTLGTLYAMTTALNVPLGELLDAPAAAAEVVRAADDRPSVKGEAVSARLLHRVNVRGTVEVYDIDVAQRTQESQPHLPGVEECLMVTRGRITTGPVDAPVDLVAGDSIRFDAAHPHMYRGHDRRNHAVLLMVHTDA